MAGWVGGLLDYSVSPVQSFEIWSSTGLSLDNRSNIDLSVISIFEACFMLLIFPCIISAARSWVRSEPGWGCVVFKKQVFYGWMIKFNCQASSHFTA